MTKEMLFSNGIFAAIFGVLSAALGGWTLAIKLLICLMIADYVTGLFNGYYTKTLSSQIGFKGLFKKIVILMLIAIAALIDAALNTTFLRDVAVFFYISNEGISLLENTAKLGVPYPVQLRDALTQLGKLSDKAKMEPEEKEA